MLFWKIRKFQFSNINDAFEWEEAKAHCEEMDPFKTKTGPRGRMWYPHSEEEQKLVGKWLILYNT